MGIFDELDKRKASQSATSGGIFAKLDERRAEKTRLANVPAEKISRMAQGLPVSVGTQHAAPSFGGEIVRGALKPVANFMSNVLGGMDLSNPYLGKVEGLGKADITKSPFTKENFNVIKKSAGTGTEIASYFGYGGIAKDVTANLYKQGAKQFFKTQGKNLLKEGALTGLAESAGRQTASEQPYDFKQMIVDTGMSTALTPLAALGLNKIFGRKLPEVLRDSKIKNLLGEKDWGIITGTREVVSNKFPEQGFAHPNNLLKNKQLKDELVAKYGKKNVVELPSTKYEGGEQGVSYFVKGIPENDAMNLGKKYGQESVLTNKGFIASDGTWIQPSNGKMIVGKNALKQPGYSQLPTGETFSIDMSQNRIPTRPETVIPMGGRVEPTLQLPRPKTPGEIPIEMPSPEIMEAARRSREVPKQITPDVSRTPLENRAFNAISREDFINKERGNIDFLKEINKDKLTKGRIAEIPKVTDKQLADIWNKQHATPKSTGLPPLQKVTRKEPTIGDAVPQRTETPTARQETPSAEQVRTGQQNAEFFTGKAKKASSDVPYKATIETPQVSQKTKDAFNTFTMGGNFTGHISKMIPAFAEKQLAMTEAITKSGARSFLDIGASEGGVVKTVSHLNPKIKSVALDPNPAMLDNYNKTPDVPNTEFKMEALGASWTEPDGTLIKEFKPAQKFDVINEDFAFQFINNDRKGQVKMVRDMLNDDGIFITSEKFGTKNYAKNEAGKYAHQEKYFSPDQLTEDKQSIVTGMAKDMVQDVEYENVLKENFEHVAEYWNSGNFKGYVASNDGKKLDKFLKDIGNVNSKFSEISTPRIVKGLEIGAEELEEAGEIIRKTIDVEDWTPTTLKQQLARFKELLSTDMDKLKRLAMSTKEIDEGGLRNNWALSFLENEAQKTGDIALSKELSFSKVGSKMGGELVGGRFKDKDTVASIIREIRTERARAMGVSDNAIEKHVSELIPELKKALESMKNKIPTTEEIDNIISSIICK